MRRWFWAGIVLLFLALGAVVAVFVYLQTI